MNYLELAQECQLIGMRPHLDGIYQEALEKFASLVEEAARADEREAITNVFQEITKNGHPYMIRMTDAITTIIRARGEA